MSPATASGTGARIRAAHVRRAHGVRGAVRVEPLGGTPGRFAVGLRLTVEGDGRQVTVSEARGIPDGDLLMRFDEVLDRNSAETLHGRYLTVGASEARALGPDEWFIDTIIGLRAVTPEGEHIGEVTDVEPYAAHDVLVVHGQNGVRRFPMVRAFVRGVDSEAGTITMTPWDEER